MYQFCVILHQFKSDASSCLIPILSFVSTMTEKCLVANVLMWFVTRCNDENRYFLIFFIPIISVKGEIFKLQRVNVKEIKLTAISFRTRPSVYWHNIRKRKCCIAFLNGLKILKWIVYFNTNIFIYDILCQNLVCIYFDSMSRLP